MTAFKLRSGSASDVGQIRSINQDAVVTDGGVYAVADGMGGHQGGEVASAITVEILAEGMEEPTPEAFDALVQDANLAVFEQGQAREDLNGMGTTVVGIAEVDVDDEAHLVMVNVGDSRGYLLRDRELIQITEDHSLVADLVRAGQITPEEAEHHPRRNIVTRVLGLDSGVRVDQFAILPVIGDRFLLCSDGLINEVSDAEITETLRRVDDPDEAAIELVRMANEGGGHDNISVVIVDVLDDDGAARRASTAIATDISGLSSRDDLDELADAETEDNGDELAALGAVVAADEPEIEFADEGAEEAAADAASDTEPPKARTEGRKTSSVTFREEAEEAEALEASHEPEEKDAGDEDEIDDEERPRRFSWRVVGFLLAFFVVLGIAAGALFVYARASYYVGFDGDRVAVFQGRPDGVLFFDPTLKAHANVTEDDLVPVSVEKVNRQPDFGSYEDATAYVTKLRILGDEEPTTGPPGSFDKTKPKRTTTTSISTTTSTTDSTGGTSPNDSTVDRATTTTSG